jgi:DNA (cytosine-5)-methyltransferase 1
LEGFGYTVGAVCLPAASVGAPHIRQRLYFVGESLGAGLERHPRNGNDGYEPRRISEAASGSTAPAGSVGGFWSDAEWVRCRDNKYRPFQPGAFPMVDGATARVGRLRAYGNAIVAPVATEFIRAYINTKLNTDTVSM